MILITGAAGFIGSNLANLLYELDHETKIVILGPKSTFVKNECCKCIIIPKVTKMSNQKN